MRISSCKAISILDSRGNPTIKVELGNGTLNAQASVPSGKSAGSKEAHEKRDSDGGVDGAIKNITDRIIPVITARDFSSPNEIDTLLRELDGTPNKENLGANAMLAVSIAATKLFALEAERRPWKFIAEMNGFVPAFPRLYMNVLNGGAHADFRLPFQEYIIVAEGTPREAYDQATMVFWELGELIKKTMGPVPLGDEGGYSPQFNAIEQPFELLRSLVFPGDNISIAIDAAATEFYKDGQYTILDEIYSTDKLLEVYKNLVDRFGLMSIEDPFAENDYDGFKKMTATLGERILVVGDDLTVTNPAVLKTMIQEKAGNALIVKPNQIGTLQEVYETAHLAKDAGWKIVASHRSGETEDAFIADLAVGIGAFGIKAGAPSQKERVVKYNRLMEIEKEFGFI
ncbi:MAG: phosphopyruvate hydratase [Candidatus Yonathbacteria bacterium]|nr:phosphopyruvate hydratase [Candidatus Yonathbacteria bacterium]